MRCCSSSHDRRYRREAPTRSRLSPPSDRICATPKPGRALLLVAALAAAWLPGAAAAHHSFLGRFDRQTISELEGVLIDKRWQNPHGYFTLRVTDEDGRTTDWALETSSATLMTRLGITSEMLRLGDTIRVAGFPPITGKPEFYVRHILLPDGRELLLDIRLTPRWAERTVGERSTLTIREGDSSRPDLGIFRVWTLIRDGPRLFPEVVDPSFDPQSYPLTDSARAALAAFDLARDNPTNNCQPKGMPTIMEQPYPIEFVERGDGNILLRIEEYDLERLIHMDTSGAPPPGPSSLLGYSTGEWDQQTLVVTTTRVSWPYFSQVGIPQSPASRIIERFTPTADGSRLDYRLTVIDPINFTEPVERSVYWIWVPGTELIPYECRGP